MSEEIKEQLKGLCEATHNHTTSTRQSKGKLEEILDSFAKTCVAMSKEYRYLKHQSDGDKEPSVEMERMHRVHQSLVFGGLPSHYEKS